MQLNLYDMKGKDGVDGLWKRETLLVDKKLLEALAAKYPLAIVTGNAVTDTSLCTLLIAFINRLSRKTAHTRCREIFEGSQHSTLVQGCGVHGGYVTAKA